MNSVANDLHISRIATRQLQTQQALLTLSTGPKLFQILIGAHKDCSTLLRRIEYMNDREEVLVAALSEIMATNEGKSDQPIGDILDGCLAELSALKAARELPVVGANILCENNSTLNNGIKQST